MVKELSHDLRLGEGTNVVIIMERHLNGSSLSPAPTIDTVSAAPSGLMSTI